MSKILYAAVKAKAWTFKSNWSLLKSWSLWCWPLANSRENSTDLRLTARRGRVHSVHGHTICCVHRSSCQTLSALTTRSTASTWRSNIPFVHRYGRHVTRPTTNHTSATFYL